MKKYIIISIVFFLLIFIGNVTAVDTVYWLHNESDSQYTSYKQMKITSTDIAMVTSGVVSMTPVGIRCWNENLTTPNFTSSGTFNVTWQFYLNESVSASSNPTAYIFAQIYKINRTGSRIVVANSTMSSDIGPQGAGSNIGLLWNYTLPNSSLTNITSGDRLGVRFCLNVTTAKNQNANLYWENSTISRVIVPINVVDVTPPILTLISPLGGNNYSTSSIWFNVTSNEALSSCKYSINNWATNVTMTSFNSTYFYNLTTISNENYLAKFWCNDTSNNINSTLTSNFTVDTINPNINFTSPSDLSNSYQTRRNIVVNITINDTNLQNATIFLYNSSRSIINSTSTGLIGALFVNFTNLVNGIYYFNATAIDYAGNSNST